MRFGIYLNGKLCLKNFLEYNNIGHLLKISRDYFRPLNISIIVLCTFLKMLSFVAIVLLLTKIKPKNY